MTAQTKTSRPRSHEPKEKTTASSKSETKKNKSSSEAKKDPLNSTDTSLITTEREMDPEAAKGLTRQEKSIYMHYCATKIHDYNAAEFKDLGRNMVVLQKFLGLKGENILSGEAEDKMLEFIQDYFADMSTGEILHAFDLASAKELQGLNYERNEQHHFMQFGAPYIGTILRCYQAVRSKVILKYQLCDQELKRKPELERKKQTRDEKFHELKKLSIACWANHKTATPSAGQDKVYRFLTDIGIITHSEQILEKAQEGAIINIARADREKTGRGSTQKIEDLVQQSGPLAAQLKLRIETETYKVALNKFFNDLQDSAIELDEMFTKELEESLKIAPEPPENTKETP